MFRKRKEVREAELALESMRHRFGENSPEVVVAMINAAVQYQNAGDHRAALHLRSNVVEVQRRIYGDDSVEVINARDRLALAHFTAGDFASAYVIQREIVDSLVAVCDQNDSNVLRAKKVLARSYYEAKQFELACGMMSDVVTGYRASLGRTAPETLENSLYLGDILRQTGRFRAALAVDQEVVTAGKKAEADQRLMLTAWRSVFEDFLRMDSVAGVVGALEEMVAIGKSEGIRVATDATIADLVRMRDRIVAEVGEDRYLKVLGMVRSAG